jgi:two-component system, chemotaxis family, chemotaxis protein CheY
MKTALIVDDDIDTVDVLAEYLEYENIQVVGKAYNGKDCVELYQKSKPDLVFSDVMMPHYDGFYVLEKIRQINPNAIIIMVTGDLTSVTENRLKTLNASEIVYKPFDITKIMILVNHFFENEISIEIGT